MRDAALIVPAELVGYLRELPDERTRLPAARPRHRLPALRRGHADRESQGFRVLDVELARGAGLRLRDLEVDRGAGRSARRSSASSSRRAAPAS